MSEEKLYAIKNDSGKWADSRYTFGAGAWATPDKAKREEDAKHHGGHVVALVEEPKKVVLSKTDALRQGWLVARYGRYNPDAVSDIIARYKDEAWDMIDAYVNGYTVKKDKKYRVITPKSWWASENEPEYMHMNVPNGIENYKGADDDTLFTQKQLDLYGLNGAPFTKEEVTDDGVR